jgi:plastin-1
MDNEDMLERAKTVLANAEALNVPDVTSAESIVKANVKANTLFIAHIYNTENGLGEEEDLDEEVRQTVTNYLKEIMDLDTDGVREERAYRMWINSLDIEGVYVNDLYDDVSDGILLCKVMDMLEPGCIKWEGVKQPPKNVFEANQNCQHAIDVAKGAPFKFGLPSVAGTDFPKKNRIPVLALVWQLVRHHYLQLIGGKKEQELIQWGNAVVGDKAPAIASL